MATFAASKNGKMPEWSNGPHSKCGERVTVPGVRIPLFPLSIEKDDRLMSPFFLLIFGFFFGDNYGWTLPSVRPAGATGAEPRAERSGALVDGYVIKSAMPHCTALQNIYLAHSANLELCKQGAVTIRCTLRIPRLLL